MRPIDLLPSPQERRREELASTLPKLLVWALIVWVMLLTGVYIGFHAQKVELRQTLSSLQEQIQALQPVAERMQQIEALQRQVDQLQQLFEQNTKENMAPAMELLANLMPMEIVARNLDVDQGKLSFSCSSVGLAPIGRFKQNLLQSAHTSQVQVSAISSTGSTTVDGASVPTYSFTVSFVYQGGK